MIQVARERGMYHVVRNRISHSLLLSHAAGRTAEIWWRWWICSSDFLSYRLGWFGSGDIISAGGHVSGCDPDENGLGKGLR